jgi:CheY-like chemotaxis protein
MNWAKNIAILLVDDEEDFRRATRQVLGRRGFSVTEAESGEQALELIRSSVFDVVLLDLRMEGMDGIATLEEIRKVHPALPVIILTGHGELDDAMAGINLHIVDFVQKPAKMEQLAERIRTLVVTGRAVPLRERTVHDLMVPVASYRRLYDDQLLPDAVEALHASMSLEILGKATEKGHRSVLVYDREERFVGMIRVEDILDELLPPYLRDSPYASCFTGMFLAQSKLVGALRVGDLVGGAGSEVVTVTGDAPLMEAVHLMVSIHAVSLPVVQDGKLIGVIRDKDLLLELAGTML